MRADGESLVTRPLTELPADHGDQREWQTQLGTARTGGAGGGELPPPLFVDRSRRPTPLLTQVTFPNP